MRLLAFSNVFTFAIAVINIDNILISLIKIYNQEGINFFKNSFSFSLP